MRTEARPSVAVGGRGDVGFALGLVVFLLFAVSVLGAAGYQLVRGEATQAQYSVESAQALAVAQGGIQWFTGRQQGVVADSATYSINGGTAEITARKVATLSADEDLFFVSSRGTFTDPRRPRTPAVRTVSQYAVLKNLPVKPLAPLVTTAGRLRIRGSAVVDGTDHAFPGQCPGAPVSSWAGAVARASVQVKQGGALGGTPSFRTFGSFGKVVDAVGLAWDVLTDSDFPVEYDGIWPDYSSVAPAEFPVVRVEGDFSPTLVERGWGVLIVTGSLRIPANSNWSWKGLVLAGDLENVGSDGLFTLEGALVAGQGEPMGNRDLDSGTILYNSCYAAWAGAALSYLAAVGGGWWETF